MSVSEKLLQVAENEQNVYEAGKRAGISDFWDIVQQQGKRVDYDYAFVGPGWTADNFKPRYAPIRPSRAAAMFQKASNLNIDLSSIVDFSNCTALSNAFFGSGITKVGVVDARKLPNAHLNYVFMNARKLKTVTEIFVEKSSNFVQSFQNCEKLEDVKFNGEIGTTISFQWSSKLSKASLINIVSALSQNTIGKTITFSKAAVNAAFGVDVEVESSLTDEYWNWRVSRPDWEFIYV